MSSPHVIPITIAHQTEPVRPVLTLTTGHQNSNAEPAGVETQWVVRIPTSFLDATEHPLSDRSRYLFLVLESLARGRTYCWPSNEQLCRIMGRTKRTIQLTLDELESQGYVRRVHHETSPTLRIGIILVRRANPRDSPAADSPEAIKVAEIAIRSRRNEIMKHGQVKEFAPKPRRAQVSSPAEAQEIARAEAQEIAPKDREAQKPSPAEAQVSSPAEAQVSSPAEAQEIAPRIKTNFEEDTVSKPAIHAHAREGSGSADEDVDEPFHCPAPPAPSAKAIDLTPAPTRRDVMVAECDGTLPGCVVVDEAMLDRTHAFIDRFFPTQDNVHQFVAEHKRTIETAWLFRAVKRARARGYKRVHRNLLLAFLRDWMRDGKPDPGPEDDYDDEMNLLPAEASPEIATAPRKPRGHSPETAPVVPPPRPQLTDTQRRRLSR